MFFNEGRKIQEACQSHQMIPDENLAVVSSTI